MNKFSNYNRGFNDGVNSTKTMTLEEAKEQAQKQVKVTHKYFTDDEYMTMRGNMILFEDGVSIFFDKWIKDKPYLKDGWSIYKR